jgi:hypothetical protein
LAFEITKASTSDMTYLLPLVDDLEEHHHGIKKDADELSADKGYDSAENKATLYDDHQIKPVIDHRRMWKENPEQPRILYADRVDVALFDEFGQLYCQCPAERRGEDEVRELAFVGYEKGRKTLKYRCPAAYFGFHCAGRIECEAHAQTGDYGRVFRVPLDTDRRIFTPIARHTPKWKTAYNHRSAVERVNSRIDQVLGFERHTIRGKSKMKMRIGLALVVMLAMALGRIRLGQKKSMRSITTPIHLAA